MAFFPLSLLSGKLKLLAGGILLAGLAASHTFAWHKGNQACFKSLIRDNTKEAVKDNIANVERTEKALNELNELRRGNATLKEQLEEAVRRSNLARQPARRLTCPAVREDTTAGSRTEEVDTEDDLAFTCNLTDDELRILQDIQAATDSNMP